MLLVRRSGAGASACQPQPHNDSWHGLPAALLNNGVGRRSRWSCRPSQATCRSRSFQIAEAYDFVEVTADIAAPDVRNPFTGATLAGSFGKSGATETNKVVVGLCDSTDGSVFRIRFMPSSPGDYRYSLVYRQGELENESPFIEQRRCKSRTFSPAPCGTTIGV